MLNACTSDCGGRTRNLPAGWVANKSIENPLYKDFWMLSHAGILGSKIITVSFVLMLKLVYWCSKPSKPLCSNA